MPEAMPFVLCGACLVIALEYSEKAKEIYKKIVESYRLPDAIEMLDKLDNELGNLSGSSKHTTSFEKGYANAKSNT
jgi:hypothetical protein